MDFSSSLTLASKDAPFLMQKRIDLLEAIEKHGSISKAAKAVPMSYKSAWDAVDAMNNLGSDTVVLKATGGKGGGGARLSGYGQKLVKTYRVLQKQHEQFLAKLSEVADFDSGSLQTLQRFTMQLSARNQISGVIDKIVTDAVNANVVLTAKSGVQFFASISVDSVEALGLRKGMEAIAVFKSSNVLLAKDEATAISARNKITGQVSAVTQTATNAQVVLDIGEGENITAIVTAGAVKKLGLKKSGRCVAFIKASDIMIGL
ncbi:MAG: TOBE domain-containing protein [Campylobacterota bacterium]